MIELVKRITQQTIFNVRPVLGVALLWIPQSGKLLACGGTNWTQVTYNICKSMMISVCSFTQIGPM